MTNPLPRGPAALLADEWVVVAEGQIETHGHWYGGIGLISRVEDVALPVVLRRIKMECERLGDGHCIQIIVRAAGSGPTSEEVEKALDVLVYQAEHRDRDAPDQGVDTAYAAVLALFAAASAAQRVNIVEPAMGDVIDAIVTWGEVRGATPSRASAAAWAKVQDLVSLACTRPAPAGEVQPNYEAAYKAHEDGVLRMAGRHYPLNDEGKAMVRAIVNAALAGRATDTERGEGK